LATGSGINPTAAGIAEANVTIVGVDVLGVLTNANQTYSEDCLSLNVWTKPQVGEKKKAVLVWYDLPRGGIPQSSVVLGVSYFSDMSLRIDVSRALYSLAYAFTLFKNQN